MTSNSAGPTALLTFGVDAGRSGRRRAPRPPRRAFLRLLAPHHGGPSRAHAAELAPYEAAFAAIDADPAHLLLVGDLTPADGAGARVVATFQLSFLPGLSRRGSWRAQLEAVRVAGELRGQGVGAAMVQWALEESRRRGCSLVQLTTDKSRTAAHRFYERLGFAASHEGMKLLL